MHNKDPVRVNARSVDNFYTCVIFGAGMIGR